MIAILLILCQEKLQCCSTWMWLSICLNSLAPQVFPADFHLQKHLKSYFCAV